MRLFLFHSNLDFVFFSKNTQDDIQRTFFGILLNLNQMVITNQIWFGLTRLRKDFFVCSFIILAFFLEEKKIKT